MTIAATTVADLVDETLWGNLYVLDELPMMDAVASGGITDSATTLSYKSDQLSAEDEGTLAAGMVVEVDSELMLVTAVNTATNALTVMRGRFGTTAAAHVEDAHIIFAPKFPRYQVERSVANAIAALSPPLFAHKTLADIAVSGQPIDAPEGITYPTKFIYTYGGSWSLGAVQLLDPFPDSNTDKGLLFPGVPAGAVGHLSYVGKYVAPEATTDLLADLGLHDDYHRLVVVDATLDHVGKIDLDAVTVDVLQEWMENQGVPPNTGMSLRRALIQEYEYLMSRARRRQAALLSNVVTNTAGVLLP